MILGRSNQTGLSTNKFDGIDYNISIEGCGYVDMFVEATEELAALESAVYVADVMLEEHVLEGATNIDILLEGVVSSVFTRLKEAVQKLWAKIKQWFANVKKYFQMLFAHGKDFAKKYKVDIIKAEARCKGFKYEFYPVKDASAAFDGAGDNNQPDEDPVTRARKLLAATSETSNSEIIKEFMKKQHWGGEDSQAEFNKELKEKLLGGDTKEEFEDFQGGPSVQDMLEVLEVGAKFIQALDKDERAIGKACTKCVAELQKRENEEAKEVAKPQEPGKPKKELDKAYSLAVDLVKAESNHCVAICNIGKDVTKILMKDSESVLKRLLTHKPKKEGFELDTFDGSESLLESALKLI